MCPNCGGPQKTHDEKVLCAYCQTPIDFGDAQSEKFITKFAGGGLPSALLGKLTQALYGMECMTSHTELVATFACAELSQWRGSVPEQISLSSRVSVFLAWLIQKRHKGNESGLVTWLTVVSENADDATKCAIKEILGELSRI
jgi:hypothetical protein